MYLLEPNGYGYGKGNGYGDGDGNGYGDGNGDGYGNWDGGGHLYDADPFTPEHVICIIATRQLIREETHESNI